MENYEQVKHKAYYVPVGELELLENNPRTISKEQFDKLKKSVAERKAYFEGRPCLVNHKDGKLTVFAGNQRLRAARDLKMDKVPCVVYENLSKKEEKELTILDNIEYGKWDWEILANEYELEELEEMGLTNIKTSLADEKEIEQKPPQITTTFITFDYTDEVQIELKNETAEVLLQEMMSYRQEHGSYDGFWDERLKNE